MRPEDRIRLLHMLDAAETAAGFCRGKSRSDLDSNRMLVFAVVRAIEVIGEAAGQVSDETKAALASLPWRQMSGMRNRLIHAYFDIDLDRLWDTVSADLPPLIAELQAALQAAD